jgi:hypothetical protein
MYSVVEQQHHIPNEAKPGSRFGFLFPLLLVITGGGVTVIWVGFVVWLPLRWLEVL